MDLIKQNKPLLFSLGSLIIFWFLFWFFNESLSFKDESNSYFIVAIICNISVFIYMLLDNISLGRQINPQELESFFKQHGFDTYFSQFPGGYLTPLGEEGINISGGQRQLVAFARALFNQPKLLILDEATSAMDRKTEAFVLSLLKKLKKGMMIIFITHREYSLPKNADRVYRFT